MNSDQLQRVINENRCFSFLVKGVLSPDTLPTTVTTFPAAYICNTEESHLSGKHWIVFWFQSPLHAEYFDSFAKTPESYHPNLKDFLHRNAVSYTINTISLQSKNSTVCGYYVLFYLLMKCKHLQLNSIVDWLKRVNEPDHYVYEYVSNYFKSI